MAKFFLSHSSLDKNFVRRLASDLEELGHSYWLDERDIKIGENIPLKIEKGLADSDFIVVIMSSNSVTKPWFQKEYSASLMEELEQNKAIVLPLLLDKCEIPRLLKDKRYADFTGKYEIGLATFIGNLPVVSTASLAAKIPEIPNTHKISELIKKVQSRDYQVSTCLAETLIFAVEVGNKSLQEFCEIELQGWDQEKVDKAKVPPSYRRIEAFATLQQINMGYMGWNGNVANMFNYMRQNPKHFWPSKMINQEAVSEIESNLHLDFNSHSITKTITLQDFYNSYKIANPQVDLDPKKTNVYLYVQSREYITSVLDGIRLELSNRLINLLPEIIKTKD